MSSRARSMSSSSEPFSRAFVYGSIAYSLEDYAATIYAKLGIDTSKPIHTPADRPIFLAKEGTPIPELF